MKRIILTFGLIAGAILSLMMAVSQAFIDQIGFEKGEILGYTTMVLSFLMVFVGIRSYRDNVSGGTISFGKAFQVGILITLIASVCYVATWEVIYYGFAPDFWDKYAAHVLDKAKSSGATQQQIAAQTREMARYKELYRNPFINVAMTLIEPFPVGLVITLLCAGFLRRRDGRSGFTRASASG